MFKIEQKPYLLGDACLVGRKTTWHYWKTAELDLAILFWMLVKFKEQKLLKILF